jgi:signal-transduction protein with cAMP-binding, CBS, and nucleotidyltransferase domain
LSAIHASQLSFFAAHAPFDRMERAHLIWMMERMKLGYYAEGEVIVSPEQGAVDRFLVIKKDMVHGEQSVANATEPDTLATAQLFQIAHAQACTKNITNFAGLHDLENAQRWVSGAS